MKIHFFLLLTIFIVAACSGSNDKKQAGNTSDGTVMQSELRDTCECKDLTIDSTGLHLSNGLKYTGVCVSYYPNSSEVYMEKNILDGFLHGKNSFYDKEGNLLVQEVYEKGEKKRSGEVDYLSCDCADLEKIEGNGTDGKPRYLLDKIPFTGTCEKLYPESNQVYMKLTYKKGLLDGLSSYYAKDGTTLYHEKYSMGVHVATVH